MMSDTFKRHDDPGLCPTAQRLHIDRMAADETIQEAPTDRHLRAATGALAFLALAFIAALVWAVLVVTP